MARKSDNKTVPHIEFNNGNPNHTMNEGEYFGYIASSQGALENFPNSIVLIYVPSRFSIGGLFIYSTANFPHLYQFHEID